jgi:proprotein convertase subtilisin/kexin type 5
MDTKGYYNTSNATTSLDECLRCHRLCSRCFGESTSECYACQPNVLSLGTTCTCKPQYFDDPVQIVPASYCQRCDDFCLTCAVTKYTCQACLQIPGVQRSGTTCGCLTSQGFYIKFNSILGINECLPCHPLCWQCFGSRFDQCTLCNPGQLAVFVPPSKCVCKSGTYYESATETCVACHMFCKECEGPRNSECNGCTPSLALAVEGRPKYCVRDCFELEGYYPLIDICKRQFSLLIP